MKRTRRLGIILATGALLSMLPIGAVSACTMAGPLELGDCPSSTGGSGSSSGSAGSGSEPSSSAAGARGLLRRVNRERAERGLRRLVVDDRLASVARRHARRMAEEGAIFHNSRMFSRAGRRSLDHPTTLGENVGSGRKVSSVHRGFMKSPDHRANVLRSVYREIGVGVFKKGPRLYVVEVFAHMRSSSGGSKSGILTAGGASGDPGASRPGHASRVRVGRPGPLALPGSGDPATLPVAAVVGLLALLGLLLRPGSRVVAESEGV